MAKKIFGNLSAIMAVTTVGYMAYSVFFLPEGVVPNFKLIFVMLIPSVIVSGIYTFKYYPELFFFLVNDALKTRRKVAEKERRRRRR